MAGMVSGARMSDMDYSTSHRAPPPIPSQPYTATSPREAPEQGTEPGQPPSSSSRSRRGSLSSILHRSTSSESGSGQGHSRKEGSYITPANAPPLPTSNTLVGKVHHEAALARSESTTLPPSLAPTISHRHAYSQEGGKMLRKASRAREQERLAQERARLQEQQMQNREPPRLPSIANFQESGSADARPDSFAIFNNHYQTSSPPHPPAANFSRPGNVAMPSSSSTHTNSSSPAYALRTGNAFAQQQHLNTSSTALNAKASTSNGEYVPVERVDRSESMAHRGRYSYASSTAPVNVSSPRRVRRRKDPTPFNILVVGAKNSGKTSFISFLRHSLALPKDKKPYSLDAAGDSHVNASKSSFTSHYLETDMEGERVGLTLWDSAGLEKHIIDLQLREMAAFVEAKFEETFLEEQKVMRSPGAKDTHIHCVFLVLDPVKLDANVVASQKIGEGVLNVEGLDDEMDLQTIRALWGKTTVIPVVSKADTLTVGHMAYLKRAVWSSLKTAKLDPLEALELDEDDEASEDDGEEEGRPQDNILNDLTEDSENDYDSDTPQPKSKRNGHNRNSSLANTVSSLSTGEELPYIPMSILSPDLYDLPPYTKVSKTTKVGRRFPWGFADPYDPEHCDFVRLRDSVFSEWRGDLRDLARTKWYENWRTSRLKNLPGSKQRIKGGVTPVAAVPREGRSSPRSNRQVSAGAGAGAGVVGAQVSSVPRSVSGSTTTGGGIGMAVASEARSTSKAERMMGITAADAQSVSSRGGTYRSVDTYQ